MSAFKVNQYLLIFIIDDSLVSKSAKKKLSKIVAFGGSQSPQVS